MSRPGESRPPFEDETIYYWGQFVALVVAETFEQAQDAAFHVHVEYEEQRPEVRVDEPPHPAVAKHGPADKQFESASAKYSRGDADSAFEQAEVKLDQTYFTPVETHNPMEMHGTIAVWDRQDKLTLYETSQGVVNHHNVASQVLGMPLESIEVISPFVGSGFGCKLFPWPHSWLAAAGAKYVKRPVKVAVPRSLMFTTVGHRPMIQQRIRLGCLERRQTGGVHRVTCCSSTSKVDAYLEDCVEPASMLYSCPNVGAVQY